MASARRRHSLALAPSPPLSGIPAFAAGGSAAVAAGGRAAVAGAGSAAVAAGGRAAVAAAGSTTVTGAGSAATSASAVFRPRRPLSAVAREPGTWSGSAEDSPFPQFAPARLDMGREGDQWRSRQMQENQFNCEQIDAEEAYTGCRDAWYYSQEFSGYTDLLVNVLEKSQPVTPPSDPSPTNAGATTKNSQGRSKNFREEEDILLVSGWLNVSMDPIQGVDQTQGSFWKRIHAYFHQHKKFESNRTEGSLMNRWSGIQHDVNLFCGYLSKIELRNHSGWTVDDMISNACAMFTKGDPKGRKFTLLHCWHILKDKPKWMDKRREIGCAKKPGTKKQKTIANSSPASAAAGPVVPFPVDDDSEPPARPDGMKKEKQKLKQRSTIEAMDYLMAKKKEADVEKDLKKEERCKKAFALQEERLKLEKDKFEFHRDLEEKRILNLDLTTMSYDLQQYYAVRRQEILARRCNM